MKEKYKVSGELLLIIVLVVNSIGVQFMAKSGFGISAISSLPYAMSNVFTFISFGTWNYIFQTLLIAMLMILSRKISFGYLVSFFVGILFGKFIDFHSIWIQFLPELFVFRVMYFVAGIMCLGFGICLANNCLMPIIPTDMFPRDFSKIIKKEYQNVKTIFDFACLLLAVTVSIIFTGSVMGIGVGTIICSLFTGKIISIFNKIFESRVEVYKALNFKVLTKKATL